VDKEPLGLKKQVCHRVPMTHQLRGSPPANRGFPFLYAMVYFPYA